MRAWLGQVPLLKRRGPELLGDRRHRHSLGRSCCVSNGQLQCTDPLWISPPGNYPGYPDCGAGGPGGGGTAPTGGGGTAPGGGGGGTGPGGGGQQCPPDAQGNPQFWDGTQCRPSVGNIPGGGVTGISNPNPGGTQPGGTSPGAFPVVGGCQVPQQYTPLPSGGAGPDGAVLACKLPDGKYEVRPYGGGPPIVTGVDQACLDQFGDVTMAQEGDGRCIGGPTQGAQTGPATGACALPTGKKWIKCPPSNGVTADYYLDAETGGYAPNMTTQSPECATSANVVQVGANSPYCDGGQVWGPGSALPTLVACFRQAGRSSDPNVYGGFGETIVDVHGGPDFAVLAEGIRFADIEKRFPGQRWMYVRQERCSPLPDFGIAAAAPTPAPTPVPAPTPGTLPTTPLQQPQSALPPQQTLTYPTQPTGAMTGSPFGAPPVGFPPSGIPMPAPAPRMAPPPPPPVTPAPPPVPAPLMPIPCPPRPLKVAEWTLRCVTGVP